jgi:hypothetical protein
MEDSIRIALGAPSCNLPRETLPYKVLMLSPD